VSPNISELQFLSSVELLFVVSYSKGSLLGALNKIKQSNLEQHLINGGYKDVFISKKKKKEKMHDSCYNSNLLIKHNLLNNKNSSANERILKLTL